MRNPSGIPAMNVRFSSRDGNPFPALHTSYDTLKLYRKHVDPNLQNLETCGRFMAEVRVLAVGNSLFLSYKTIYDL